MQRDLITCLFLIDNGWSQKINKGLFVSKACRPFALVHMGLGRHYKWYSWPGIDCAGEVLPYSILAVMQDVDAVLPDLLSFQEKPSI